MLCHKSYLASFKIYSEDSFLTELFRRLSTLKTLSYEALCFFLSLFIFALVMF